MVRGVSEIVKGGVELAKEVINIKIYATEQVLDR